MKKLLLSFLLFIPIPPAYSLTLSQLISESRALSLDNDSSGSSRYRFSDSQITQWINDAQRVSVLSTRPILRHYTFELALNTTYYSLPSDFLQLYRARIKNQRLDELSILALDKKGDKWEETTGQPTNYFVDFTSRTKIGMYPWPADSSSTGTVTVDYFSQAIDLSSAGDVPYNSITEMYPYHYALSYYAAARMCALDARTDLAAFYLQSFNQALQKMSEEAKSRPSYSPNLSPGPR